MVAYSFKGRFRPAIEARTKVQTMRAVGKKRHARKGELITMTTGDRFHPVKFGAARAILVAPVTLDFEGRHAFWIQEREPAVGNVQIDIEGAQLDVFARSDGFEDWADLESFFRQTYAAPAWSGIRIFWGDTFASLITPAGDPTNV